MPVDDEGLIDRACEVFDLQRGADPGLSIVVPWYDLEMTDEELVKAVARHYFYPILKGGLEVIVETATVQKILDAARIVSAVEEIGGGLAGELRPLLELARWACNREQGDFLVVQAPPVNRAPNWALELIPEETRNAIRTALQSGNKVAVRVPLHVRKKDAEPELSFFDVFLARDAGEGRGRPVFVREGIIISDVRAPRTRGITSLVIAEDKPLANLLGDAEIPAHTRWQAGSRFKDKYRFGRSYLDFVTRSVHEIMGSLSESETEEDPTLLIDIFSLPAPPEQEGRRARRRRSGDEPGPHPPAPVPPVPPPPPRRFRVEKARGGFSVLPGQPGTTPPPFLDIRVAYDIRRGNPLKKYHRADFQMNRPPIRLEPEPRGVEVLHRQGNHIVVAVRDPDFSLHITGFDAKRDLYVRVVPKEDTDGNPTA